MNIHFIQHEIFEAPGAYLKWAAQRNHQVSFSKVYENQPLPEHIDNIDLLVILGGPQSPDTLLSECPHFDAKAEIEVIRKAIDTGKAVVGVCLGAQLIGEALDGSFENSPEKEIGVFPIHLTENGLADDHIKHFGETIPVGHWHNDMPGLTKEAEILATSIGCPRQIIKYKELVYGFQCHMEFTKEVADMMIDTEIDFLSSQTQHQFVQRIEEIRSFDYEKMNENLYIFLDKLMKSYNK